MYAIASHHRCCRSARFSVRSIRERFHDAHAEWLGVYRWTTKMRDVRQADAREGSFSIDQLSCSSGQVPNVQVRYSVAVSRA